MTIYEPLTTEEAFQQVTVGVHTGLRKGSEAPSSGSLWQAISDSDDSAWSDAVHYCLWGLEAQGIVICRKVES